MNENKKWNLFLISSVIIIFLLAFVMGYYIGRGGVNIKLADAQTTIESLRVTVGNLDKAVKRAGIENKRLRSIYENDRTRITELEGFNTELRASNKRTTKLLEQQRNLIDAITSGNTIAEESSVGITRGLGEAIQTVDNIIKSI